MEGEIVFDVTKVTGKMKIITKTFWPLDSRKKKTTEEHFALFRSNPQNPKPHQGEGGDLEHDLTEDF